jgi:hypothetical protein
LSDTIRLKFNSQVKPVLSDRDGEVNTNWVDGGTSDVISAIDSAPTNGGSGYSIDDVLTLTDGSSDATAKVLAIAAPAIVDSYSEADLSSNNLFHFTVGQSFTGDGKNLTSCKFYLSKTGSPTGFCRAKLYAHSGTFGTSSVGTGDALATSDNVDVSTLTGDLTLTTFNFPAPYTMANGTHYVIAIEYLGGDMSNCVRIGNFSYPAPTHAGNSCGGVVPTWYPEVSTDICFYVYGISGEVTEVELLTGGTSGYTTGTGKATTVSPSGGSGCTLNITGVAVILSVITADATHIYSGTKSFKLVANATGNFTTNFAFLASANNATFTVSKKYCVIVWVYAVTAIKFKIKTGGIESSEMTCVAGVWTAFPFVFTASSVTTAFQIAVTTSGGGTIWFELGEIREYSDIPVLSIKGMTAGDYVQFFPPIMNQILDGSKETQFMAFIRQIKLDCYPIHNGSAEELAILYWHLDNNRKVDYGTEYDVDWCPQNPDGYELEWVDDFKEIKRWAEDFSESIARTVFPA